MPPSIDFAAFIDYITGEIHAFYRSLNIENHVLHHSQDRIMASLIVYSRIRHELWFIGDCQALTNRDYYGYEKEVDSIIGKARSLLVYSFLQSGMTEEEMLMNDPTRAQIEPLIKAQTKLQNKTGSPYAYAIADGFPIDHSLCRIVKLHPEEREIILGSDGYPKLLATLSQSEQFLKDNLASDPLQYKSFQRTKGVPPGGRSFDDRTYIRFTID